MSEAGKTGPEPSRAGVRTDATEGLIPPPLKSGAIDALRDCLGAEKLFWDKDTQRWRAEPDYPVRLKAAELTLAYAEGRPVERKLTITSTMETFEDKKSSLLQSREGIRSLVDLKLISEKEAEEAYSRIIDAQT